VNLSAYKGKNRLFLIFAPSAADEEYREQERRLAGQENGFEDRDLLALRLFEDASAAGLRNTLGVEAGRFAVVLVGKDGGEKARWSGPVSPREVFDRVDAMPMRRREMREKER
jgi:hypothetical protein